MATKTEKPEKKPYVTPTSNPLWSLQESMTVKVTMTQPLLATLPENPEIYQDFIVAKGPTKPGQVEEIELHKAALQKRMEAERARVMERIAQMRREGAEEPDEVAARPVTVFARNADNQLVLRDYYVRGFMKAALRAFIELGIAPPSLNPWNYKGSVDQFLHVNPVHIQLLDASGKPISEAAGHNVRTQRVTTMQGDRVCLACSEELPPGTCAQFELKWFRSQSGKVKQAFWDKAMVSYLLDFGSVVGFGQWRSGGYGRFIWEEVKSSNP